MTDDHSLRESLQEHYGTAARRVIQRTANDQGCEPESCGTANFGAGLYDEADLEGIPQRAVAGSLGCANPVALAQLEPGEDVLDLGSGGGIDVLLSAHRVGPTGKAYGVDMTPEMLVLAWENAEQAGVRNAEFLEGRIEDVPLPDSSIDVVMSNCVIGLSARKDKVFSEAFRVLRPGGRLAVADVVANNKTDTALSAANVEWAACLAGAATRDRHRAQLINSGFVDIEITDSHEVGDGLWSVFVRARKP